MVIQIELSFQLTRGLISIIYFAKNGMKTNTSIYKCTLNPKGNTILQLFSN
jgi:hypothetical protein